MSLPRPFHLAVFDQMVSAGGVRRFTLAMLQHWLADADCTISLYWPERDTSGLPLTSPFPQAPNLIYRPIPAGLPAGQGVAWLAGNLAPDVDLVYFTSYVKMLSTDQDVRLPVPAVVTLHDLAHEFTPAWGPHTAAVQLETRQWTNFVQAIIFSSDFIRNESARIYHYDPAKAHRVYLAPPLVEAAPPPPEEVARVRGRYGLPARFIISPGTAMVHKNPIVIVDAVGQLKSQGLNIPLVLLGPLTENVAPGFSGPATSPYHQAIQERVRHWGLEVGRDLFVLGHVPDDDMTALYHAASVVVTASVSEAGLSGPVLEGLWHRRPVICSAIPPFVERLGADDRLVSMFDPRDSQDLALALRRWAADPAAAEARAGLARMWTDQRQWRDCANEYFAIFRKVARAASQPAQAAAPAAAPAKPELAGLLEAADAAFVASDLPLAREKLAAALALGPGDPALRVAYGNILLRLDDPAGAEAEFRRAAQDAPGHAPAHSNLAGLLAVQGRQAEAEAEARRAQELDPADPGARRVLDFLARPAETQAAPEAAAELPALAVRWEGSQFVHHSLALVNRELCLQLSARDDVSLSIIPYEPDQFGPAADPRFPRLAGLVNRKLPAADVHVRHQWPPNFNPPAEGHWVMIQPWEYGGIPRQWIDVMRAQVDEVWAPSSFVRQCYIESGLPADRVQVVPNGVDVARFSPSAPPLALTTRKKFKFLFVGGTIWRKGPDVLLAAYLKAFTAADDVCLVIKDMGGDSFYKGQTLAQQIKDLAAAPGAPEILYLTEPIAPADMPGLYTACDCLVHPYRGEGFGLPIAEAMACGLPVVVTGAGACLDFCDADSAYLIPAARRDMGEKKVGQWELAAPAYVYEPDPDAAARLMRQVYEHPAEAGRKGAAARARITAGFSWEAAGRAARLRLAELSRRPARRAPTAGTERLTAVLADCGPAAEAWLALSQHTSQPLDLRVVSDGAFTPPALPAKWRLTPAAGSLVQALNEALSAPDDSPVLLLSSDVIPAAGWLESLTAALQVDPALAAVGPVADRAPSPQQVEPRGNDPKFAAKRARKFAGRVRAVDYLGGFCLLLSRAAFRAAGPLNEELSIADAIWDYYSRAAAAGFGLAAAEDVFVRHAELSEAEGLGYDELRDAQSRVQALMEEGRQAEAAQDWPRASAAYQTLADEYPGLPGAHAALGAALMAQSDFAGAAHAFAGAVDHDPESAGLRNQLGVALYREGHSAGAEQAFEGALRLEPANVDALLNLVDLYMAEARLPDAAARITAALGLAPKNPDVLTAFGRLGLALGDAEAVRLAALNLERVDPAHPAITALRQALPVAA